MLKFSTRSAAREYASKRGYKVVDLGKDVQGSRWAVRVI